MFFEKGSTPFGRDRMLRIVDGDVPETAHPDAHLTHDDERVSVVALP
jgi:hypothetical protein